MPISPYIRELRASIGTRRLLLPSVSAHIFDSSRRLLLVKHRESGVWSTPGGSMEPDERPADAVVREVWEETGLLVVPRQLVGVYGGPECVVRYVNGDEAQYVVIAFECEITGGTLRADGDETVEARYFSEPDAAGLLLSSWLPPALATVYGRDRSFLDAKWSPRP
ncbi:MAG: NUDIX domain-containing protein [Gemmatimonadaceae bacterium]